MRRPLSILSMHVFETADGKWKLQLLNLYAAAAGSDNFTSRCVR